MRAFYRRCIMKKKSSRLMKAILSTAKDMHEAGILDKADHEKITMRHLKDKGQPTIDPITC